MSHRDFKSFKDEIVEKTGFKEERIKRSLLYKPPEGFTINIP
jgi:hypothetical protein